MFFSRRVSSALRVIKRGCFIFPQHFVSERKYDEDLGKAVRFTFDLEPLKSSITGFGSGRSSLFSLTLTRSHMTSSASAVVHLWPLFQFTIRVQDTQIGPAVAPRPPPLPARASRTRHRLLVLLPRPRTRPAKPVHHRTNRSARRFPFASFLGVKAGAQLTS